MSTHKPNIGVVVLEIARYILSEWFQISTFLNTNLQPARKAFIVNSIIHVDPNSMVVYEHVWEWKSNLTADVASKPTMHNTCVQ